MNAVDTNIFVYAADDDEPVKQAKSKELLKRLFDNRPETTMLWQVAGEYLNCLRRWQSRNQMSAEDVDTNVRDALASFPLALPTANIISRSLSLSSRYSLSHWDSMLLAACIDAGVDTLYSEDLDAGMTYDTVTVVNPFD